MAGSFSLEANPLQGISADTGILVETGITLNYAIAGFGLLPRQFHCHANGDIYSPTGYASLAHFIGQSPTREQVGQLGNGLSITGDNGIATGSFSDKPAMLDGVNSILGRALIVHGDTTDPLGRVAQCIIGKTVLAPTSETPYMPMLTPDRPPIREATCSLSATQYNTDAELIGYVDFDVNHDYNDTVEIRFP